MCRLPPWTIALIVIGAIANVINIVDVVPVIIHDLRICYLKGGELSQMHKNMHTQLLKM